MKTIYQLFFFVLSLTLFSCNEQKVQATSVEQATTSPTTTDSNIYATLVAKNGKLVSEEYFNGQQKDDLHHIQSLAKGIMSILVGIAIDQAYLKSENDPIQMYLEEEFSTIENDKKKEITIKHLLNQTSGLAWEGHLEHKNWLNSPNPIWYVLNKKLVHPPGSTYNYNSGATHLLSAVLTKATGKTTLAFANEFLFSPLGIGKVDWQKRNDGYYDGSGLGLKMRPMDLMKIGQLLSQKGKSGGKQLVAPAWIEKLFSATEKSETTWGLANSTHGFCWYKAELNGATVDYGMGYGGQFILMIPAKHLVIVTTHQHDTPTGIEQQIKFLNTKLPKLIEQHSEH